MKTQIAITGALSYTGRYITKNLIERFGAKNLKIINLENFELPNPFKDSGLEIVTVPYTFDKPDQIKKSIEGSKLMVGTYWVRFDDFKGGPTRAQVIDNAKTLVDCARDAGVDRYVYTSHTQSDINCHIPYIAGKANVEAYVKKEFQGRYGIVKPCAIFGDTPDESIIVNNISYLLRTFPVMAIVGDGNYPFHPVHVEDMARLCIESGLDDLGEGEYDWDAVNPEKTSYIDFLKTTRDIVGAKTVFVKHVPADVAYYCTKPMNWWFKDILIDRGDIDLMTNHITCSHKDVLTKIKYSDWLRTNKDELGKQYINSLSRYYSR